jgi:hypothetical protein
MHSYRTQVVLFTSLSAIHNRRVVWLTRLSIDMSLVDPSKLPHLASQDACVTACMNTKREHCFSHRIWSEANPFPFTPSVRSYIPTTGFSNIQRATLA